MSTTLLLGANGQLGIAVVESAPESENLVVKTHHDLDLLDTENLNRVVEHVGPSTIINCAAYTEVDQAEKEPERAYAINSVAVGVLAQIVSNDVRIIHISTDFVFSKMSDKPYLPSHEVRPVSVYGKSKLEGEQRLLEHHPANTQIIRTSWLYSATGKNFVLTMLRLMDEREEIRVVADQFGSPTSTMSLAEVIWKMHATECEPGIYHWSDSGVISWYEFAKEIYRQGLEKNILKKHVDIIPISSNEYPTPAQRPEYSALNCSETEKVLGIEARAWQQSLSDVLGVIKKNEAI